LATGALATGELATEESTTVERRREKRANAAVTREILMLEAIFVGQTDVIMSSLLISLVSLFLTFVSWKIVATWLWLNGPHSLGYI
jgi:hypothetical protein